MKWLLSKRFSHLELLGLIIGFAISSHDYWHGALFLFGWFLAVSLIEHHYHKRVIK